MKVKHALENSTFSDLREDLHTALGVNDLSAYYNQAHSSSNVLLKGDELHITDIDGITTTFCLQGD